MSDPGIIRASERVELACRALAAAASDLAVARKREGAPIDDTAQELESEVERVCQLAEELGKCARSLGAAGVRPRSAKAARVPVARQT